METNTHSCRIQSLFQPCHFTRLEFCPKCQNIWRCDLQFATLMSFSFSFSCSIFPIEL